ncbi:MAG: hypothetical protein IJZ64_02315 [Ruminococcus sp.]|nr:hypothetical protein [Ruminococcus sp.]
MAIFYVFQGETYIEEYSGGYVWAPQRNSSGHKNIGYTMMTNIKKDDFILHNKKGNIVAISIAQTDCYNAIQPKELLQANTTVNWQSEGYRVDTKYFEFDTPLNVKNYRDWLKDHYVKESAFNRFGKGKQQYMCRLAKEHADFLINNAIRLQKDTDLLLCLNKALSSIV